MKNAFYLLTLIFILGSCNGSSEQPGVYGERPLDLKKLTFNMDMQGFFPAERIIDNAPLQYIVEIGKEAKNDPDITDDDLHIIREVVWDETRQNETIFHYYASDLLNRLPLHYRLAAFGDFYFNKMNIATTGQNELIMVSALSRESDSDTAKKLFYELSRTYGEPARTRAIYEGLQECEVFTWEKKDRVIKYYWTLSTIFEKNDLRNLHLYVIKKDKLGDALPLLRLEETAHHR